MEIDEHAGVGSEGAANLDLDDLTRPVAGLSAYPLLDGAHTLVGSKEDQPYLLKVLIISFSFHFPY